MSYKIAYKSLHCVLVNSDITANTVGLDDFIEDPIPALLLCHKEAQSCRDEPFEAKSSKCSRTISCYKLTQ